MAKLTSNPTSAATGPWRPSRELEDTIRFAAGRCSLGALVVARSGRGLCAILLGDESEALIGDLRRQYPHAVDAGRDADLADALDRVATLVENPAAELGLPLDLRGSDFMREVWQALRDIPAGATASYGEVARRIGAPASARAVARACATNPLAVAIPCHRVVRADGGLSGYRWGVERKRALLAREGGR
ncbi:MAG TPA: methylated-DNA--[protein]-cysteine S-methyltransferase [Gemmatimonadales bacterium]|nr:methylated-DNA--[protein]-cysteine S-methyltransferase [Gemmatimonadales bacterium]